MTKQQDAQPKNGSNGYKTTLLSIAAAAIMVLLSANSYLLREQINDLKKVDSEIKVIAAINAAAIRECEKEVSDRTERITRIETLTTSELNHIKTALNDIQKQLKEQ